MLDKGRRALEGERQGRDLMNGYLFGDFDYADRQLLKFLRTGDARVRELLREGGDDEAVAEALLRESGRSEEEVRAWSEKFRKGCAPFIAMWDADEGRAGPGIGAALIKFIYNFALMPPVYLVFRVAEGMRRIHNLELRKSGRKEGGGS
jgi:hypothetical protein